MAKTRAVGLDIGDTQLRAVELGLDSGNPHLAPTIRRYAEIDLPHEAVRDGEVLRSAEVSRLLRELWRRGGFTAKEAIIGVGGQSVIVRDAQFPSAPLPQIRQALPFSVEDLIVGSVDDLMLDFYPLSESQGQTTGLLVAAPKSTIEHAVDAVLAAGLQPSRVDLSAFALVRALARGQFGQGVVGLVDVGAVATTVVVAAHGQPAIMRILAAGGNTITDRIASSAGISTSMAERLKLEIALMNPGEANEQAHAAFTVIADRCQAMVQQVARTFSFYAQSSGQAVGHVVVSGRGGMLNGLGQYMSTALRLPASFAAFDTTFGLERTANPPTPAQRMSLPVAVGLAMGALA